MITAIVTVGWAACALLACGITTAYFQREYPDVCDNFLDDLGSSLVLGLMGGPVALFVVFLLSGFARHGFMLLRPRRSKDSR